MTLKIGAAVSAFVVMLPASGAAQSAQSAASGDHWIASGFVGSNFANNADPASTAFGGAIGFLLKNRYGVELDTGFTPDFELQSKFFGLGIKPQVNTFMGNAIYAPPLGPEGRLQPFISGGVGAISLRAGSNEMGLAFGDTSGPADTRFGGNVGGGFMGFVGNWGLKADLRYYRATGSYNTTAPAANPGNPSLPPGSIYVTTGGGTGAASGSASDTAPASPDQSASSLTSAALSGLHFWRANVGIAVRW